MGKPSSRLGSLPACTLRPINPGGFPRVNFVESYFSLLLGPWKMGVGLVYVSSREEVFQQGLKEGVKVMVY